MTQFGPCAKCGRPVPGAFAERGVEGGALLGAEHVDLGGGEVGQPAGVVEVEMGDGDVADVGGVEAQRLDPRERGLLDPGLRPQREVERHAEALVRMLRVLGAEARFHEDELLAGLDQQAVAHHCGRAQAALAGDPALAEGAERAGADVVDLHRVSLPQPPGACADPGSDLGAAGLAATLPPALAATLMVLAFRLSD